MNLSEKKRKKTTYSLVAGGRGTRPPLQKIHRSCKYLPKCKFLLDKMKHYMHVKWIIFTKYTKKWLFKIWVFETFLKSILLSNKDFEFLSQGKLLFKSSWNDQNPSQKMVFLSFYFAFSKLMVISIYACYSFRCLTWLSTRLTWRSRWRRTRFWRRESTSRRPTCHTKTKARKRRAPRSSCLKVKAARPLPTLSRGPTR